MCKQTNKQTSGVVSDEVGGVAVCRSSLLPLRSCYAMTSSSSSSSSSTSTRPSSPAPSPSLPPGTNRPADLFLCKKTRGWGPFAATPNLTWERAPPPRPRHTPNTLSALQNGRHLCFKERKKKQEEEARGHCHVPYR